MSDETASYAVSEANSRGRKFAESPHPYRNAFERDRDRIIHCDAFRRLAGKTQVFAPGLDDNYRSRFSHSIEVSQIGRTLARVLGLNETLTEAICLAHDLGHSPFGHAGETVLNRLAASFGGFEHNRQSLRIVDLLEHPYADFAGLNLMYETRLGLAKHRSPYDEPSQNEFNEPCCCLEGQAADIADRIAYNCHDLEDAMRGGMFMAEQLDDLQIAAEAAQKINADAIEDGSIRRTRISKAIIDTLVSDVIETSRKNMVAAKVKSLADVYAGGKNLIMLSDDAQAKLVVFERFLMDKVYMHPSLREAQKQVGVWLEGLFGLFKEKPELMPIHYQKLIEQEGLERTAIDYIAGMTDRFCIRTFEAQGQK
jgi:dGTPase